MCAVLSSKQIQWKLNKQRDKEQNIERISKLLVEQYNAAHARSILKASKLQRN